jgi:hypothetical protein
VPVCSSRAFRKYDSTCPAFVSAQLRTLANSGNGSGEAHCFAARKTDTVRLDVFSVHQPIIADFSTGPPDVQSRTQIRLHTMGRGGTLSMRNLRPSISLAYSRACVRTPVSNFHGLTWSYSSVTRMTNMRPTRRQRNRVRFQSVTVLKRLRANWALLVSARTPIVSA